MIKLLFGCLFIGSVFVDYCCCRAAALSERKRKGMPAITDEGEGSRNNRS